MVYNTSFKTAVYFSFESPDFSSSGRHKIDDKYVFCITLMQFYEIFSFWHFRGTGGIKKKNHAHVHVFTGGIWPKISRGLLIFHGKFPRLFHGKKIFFTGENPKIFTGGKIFFLGKKKALGLWGLWGTRGPKFAKISNWVQEKKTSCKGIKPS